MRARTRAVVTALTCAWAVAGCVSVQTGLGGTAEPADRDAGLSGPRLDLPSPESAKLRQYYANVQQTLLGQGLLRTDDGARDALFTIADITENFTRTALFQEYAAVGDQMSARQSAATLKRWDEPVRIDVQIGGAIPHQQEMADRRVVQSFASRLAEVTRHSVSAGSGLPNFHVLFLDENARKAAGPTLRHLIPQIGDATLNTVLNLRRSIYCVALASDPEDDGTYDAVVIIIRAELPELMRRMCIHEEMAQGMGLSNDSETARPSIFNDDSEFAFLTGHDEILLRMLYDGHLQPGMGLAEAKPIIGRLAAQYGPGSG